MDVKDLGVKMQIYFNKLKDRTKKRHVDVGVMMPIGCPLSVSLIANGKVHAEREP